MTNGRGYRKRNRINQQFSVHLIEMLESPSYRALSKSAHLVIARIEIELAAHGGNDNGRLPVTTDDFVRYGMHRTSVAPAIREAEALGFIRVTERGRGGNADHRSPNRFFLTFANARDSRAQPPTHDWRRIKTLEEAEQIASAARANKNPRAVAFGKQNWRKRQRHPLTLRKNQAGLPEETETSSETSQVSVRVFRTEEANFPVRENRTTGSGGKPELLSRVSGGVRRREDL